LFLENELSGSDVERAGSGSCLTVNCDMEAVLNIRVFLYYNVGNMKKKERKQQELGDISIFQTYSLKESFKNARAIRKEAG